ncbi:MAG: hypothetical protein Tsb0021_01320 [Chlamydiales bacterium]
MPLKDNLSFIFLKRQKQQTLEELMSRQNLEQVIENFDETFKKASSMKLSIPKFAIQSQSNLFEDLSALPIIQSLKETFHAEKSVHFEKMVNRTELTVNEEGASLVSATYTPVYTESCPSPPFKLNEPFVFFLFDKDRNAVVALGGSSL